MKATGRLSEAHAIHCADCPIRARAVCSYVEQTELQKLNALKYYKSFGPGQEIVAAGEESTAIGSVVEGVVSLSKTMVDGRRQMVGLMFASDFIGRPQVPVAPYDAVAVTDVTLCLFPRTRFERLLQDTPGLERRLLEIALDELDAAREWMLLLGRKSAREKISTFLTILARRTAAASGESLGDGITVTLPITREAIGDYLGLTIETVSRQLTSLRKDGVISLKGSRSIGIPDYAELLDAAGEDADGGLIA
ncbi:MAG: Crp/Fnr family transcriptional regulator [Pseudomonadota bacterium]